MHRPVSFRRVTRWMRSIRPSSPWWCGTRCPHPSIFFICTYLVHSKCNGPSSFRDTIQLINLLLFFFLSLYPLPHFVPQSNALDADYPTVLSMMMWYKMSASIRILHMYTPCTQQKQRSCKFLCYDSANSFPSIFFSSLFTVFVITKPFFRVRS